MKLAVKVLTKSDLTFFKAQHRAQNSGNQKSINLNRDVFVDQLFPDLPEAITANRGELGVQLRINGPGAAYEQMSIRRKIAKGDGYKNYRLNGEVVPDPESEPGRFDNVAPGDMALLAFEGSGVPTSIRLFVISVSLAEDAALAAALALPPGRRSMAVPSKADFATAIAAAPANHPVHSLFLDPETEEDLERAALGDVEAADRLLGRPGRRSVSAEQLADMRRHAEETGQDGERLVNASLSTTSETFVWRSAQNAISPWDFEIGSESALRRIEVKATRGSHATPFHLSMAELRAAADDVIYALWRVSELGEEGGQLQTMESFGAFARDLISKLKSLPEGVRPDGFTIDPAILSWTTARPLTWPDSDV